MKRILVTGGAGFIGSAICNHFLESGHEVFVIDDLSFGNRDFVKIGNDHFFQLDILGATALAETVHQINPHWLLHLAAVHFIPWCNEHPEEARSINITGTQNVCNAAKGCTELEKLLFASTAAVYPIYDEAVTEKHPVGPLDVYGESKLEGEKICAQFHEETTIATTLCRFFNAFGPNETNPHLIPEIQKQIQGGARTIQLGNLDPKRDFIHTSDMALGVEAMLMLDNSFEVFNLGRGIEYSVREVVESFSRVIGEDIAIEVDPVRVRKTERMHLLADVSKLKTATGWEPNWDLDQGIKSLVDS